MESTKELLQNVNFQSRGKWYKASEVDAFIEQMIVGTEELTREKGVLEERVRVLELQLKQGKEEAQSSQEGAQGLPRQEEKTEPWVIKTAQHQQKICDELEKERDELIENIQQLRQFRQAFKETLKDDIERISQQLTVLDENSFL